MNAYELADEYGTYAESHDWGKQAQDMLRQQAEKLKKYELRNLAQCDRIAILEAQVYGGTTK